MRGDSQPTLAYLMTDVVGSTRLWEQSREEMARAVVRLDVVCADAIDQARGTLLKSRGEGDSHFGVFESADDALLAAINLAIAIRSDPLLEKIVLRTGVHLGTAEAWAGDYYGPTVNRCARIRQAACPGQILVSEAVQVVASSSGKFAFKDLGVHRLRDLLQPGRLYQLLHPELEATFGPPDSLSELAHNLPSHLSTFIGRQDDIAALGELLDANRLTTVFGAGGVGKTRLVQQVAAERIESFKDGAWFIPLDQTDRPESVIPILCKELEAGPEATEAKLVEALAHRHMLLILDNCEHLHGECRRVVGLLLSHCPHLRILATSRRVLEVPGEFVHRLEGLRLPEPHQFHEAPRFDGFRLFVERARQHGTVLPINEATIPDIVALCAKLDGLPLALEVAASRTDILSVREITRSIGECLETPTGHGPDNPRQHTIAGTIAWSRRLLSSDARTLLRRVVIFPNTWTLDGAGDVCLPETPRARLRELVRELLNNSMVFSARTARDDLRFGLLQTTREVVAAEEGDSADLAPAFIAFCAKTIDAAQALVDAGEEAHAHELLELDYEALAKALDLSFDRDPAHCAAMALALRGFWMSGTRLPEGRAWYERLARCENLEDTTRVAIQIALSSLYILLGDNGRAQDVLVAAEQIVLPLGGFELARVMGNLAVLRDRMGRYEEAKRGFERCCELFSGCGARREEALSLLNLGVAKLRLKEPHAECVELYCHALQCAKDAGLASLEAKAYSCLAHIDLLEGRSTEALLKNRQALRLWLEDLTIPDCELAMLDLADLYAGLVRPDACAKMVHIAERLEELSQSPFPSVHQDRLTSLRDAARLHYSQADWRSGQRQTRSKSAHELVTLAIQIVEAESIQD